MAKKKYTKIGAILKGDYGPFMVTGDTKGNPEYQYEVQIMVKKANGEQLVLKNPMISLFDPRNAKVEEGKEPRNVSEKLLFEVMLSQPLEE